MDKASIVIPHFNRPEILAPCLESLRVLAAKSPPFEVVVVDDASTDPSVEWIKSHHPEVLLVESPENGGFVAATNRGIEACTGNVLVFLNNDTRVPDTWLASLLEPLLTGRVEGATGSILLDWEGTRATFKGGTVNLLGFGFEDQGEAPSPSIPPFPQLFVCGGAMAIPREVYAAAGGFDPSYVGLYEDVDLGWRLNVLGYDCVLVPGSQVFHRAHASLGQQSFERKAPRYIGNSVRTVFKNVDEGEHLARVEMAVTLAQARERVCLLGQSLRRSFWERLAGPFRAAAASTPIIDQLVSEEERTRELQRKRRNLEERRKRSSQELFDRFVPDPTRGWYYDLEQERLLKESGYWDFERETYRRFGYAV